MLPDISSIKNTNPVVYGRPLTKAGRLSLKGSYEGQAVKIFECANENHAASIHKIMNESALAEFFPRSHFHSHSFIVCDWAAGKKIKERAPFFDRKHIENFFASSADFFYKAHQTQTPDNIGFDYIEDYIKPRFCHACSALGIEHYKDEALESLQQLSNSVTALCHADLKPANVVFDKSGQMVIIDNELLAGSRIPVLDELNLLQGISPGIIKMFPQQIQKILTQTIKIYNSNKENDLFNVWMIRKVGSLYVAGKIHEILNLASMTKPEQKNCIKLWQTLKKLSTS